MSLSSDQEAERLHHLRWFYERAGTVIPWPKREDSGFQLVTLAKGIFKPTHSDLALSVRIAIGSPYPDAPEISSDGKWIVRYHEERNPGEGKILFTNLGLLRCMERRAPVAVLQQIERRPRALYRVLGLGLVTAYAHGFFVIEGPVGPLAITDRQTSGDDGAMQTNFQQQLDARERLLCEIVRRQGQGGFRTELLRAYSARCALTGCAVEEVLEAAHIAPYMGRHTNVVSNGLLLRADIHTLFDLGLIRISSGDLSVSVSASVCSDYLDLSLRLPEKLPDRPSREALRIREAINNGPQKNDLS